MQIRPVQNDLGRFKQNNISNTVKDKLSHLWLRWATSNFTAYKPQLILNFISRPYWHLATAHIFLSHRRVTLHGSPNLKFLSHPWVRPFDLKVLKVSHYWITLLRNINLLGHYRVTLSKLEISQPLLSHIFQLLNFSATNEVHFPNFEFLSHYWVTLSKLWIAQPLLSYTFQTLNCSATTELHVSNR